MTAQAYLDLDQCMRGDEGVERSHVAGLDSALPYANELLLYPHPKLLEGTGHRTTFIHTGNQGREKLDVGEDTEPLVYREAALINEV